MDEIEQGLVTEFVQNGSEQAFRQIEQRYAALVYSAAYRRLHDHHLAQDASQAAFIVFARKAARLKRSVRLAGWFWQTAVNAARHIERERAARAKREEKAAMQAEDGRERLWEQIAPQLDAALQSLHGPTRDALIAHYLQGKTQREIAEAWGVHADAVRRRIKSGLGRLRKMLAARGTAVRSAVLIGLLSSRTAEAMSTELFDAIHHTAWGVSTGALALEGSANAIAKGVMRMMTWSKIKVGAACMSTAAVVGGFTAVVAVQTAQPPQTEYLWTAITPQPKEMQSAGRAVPVAGGTILLAGNEPKLAVAADELNRRLTEELDAAALDVKAGGPADVRAAAGPVIVIGVRGAGQMPGVTAAYPVTVPDKTEGYAIAVHNAGAKPVVVLAGHDAQGALYAAVTLRFLLVPADGAKTPNGKAALELATIRDWPDFPWRQIGKPPANVGIGWELRGASRKKDEKALARAGEAFVAENKRYVDFMLRHKINLSWSHVTHLFAGGEAQYKYARMVSDYARARGVAFIASSQTNVGTYPRDKDDPKISRCVDHRVHKKYFCWSMPDVHEQRARDMAKAMKESGHDWLYLHATDGGGWENPARWGERCEHCKKMFGDDHAAADAAVFGTYYRVIKKQIPDFKLIAVVYPYNGSHIDPIAVEKRLVHGSGNIPNAKALAKKITDGHQHFLTRLGKLMPPDIYICQREVPREQYALMTKCYGKRPFQIYLEVKHGRGWNPEFTITSGWLKTFYRPGYQDIFYSAHGPWGLDYLTELMSAEHGWTVNAPGAKEFTSGSVRQYDIDHHIEPPDIAQKYIAKFCNDFYGPEIGPYMVPVYDSNIGFRFIVRPAEIRRNMRLRDATARMQQMSDATGRAWDSLRQARKAYDEARAAGRKPIPNRLAAEMFGEMYRAVLISASLAPFQLCMLQARPAVISGDMEKAKQLTARARALVEQGKAQLKAESAWMRQVPINRKRNPNFVWTFGQFQVWDWAKQSEQVAKFEKNMDDLFEAYNTPKWFKNAMKERVLYAVPAKTAPKIDGRLDEKVWQTATKNEHFVNHKTSTPAEKETEARILYDADALYVGYTVYEPGADKIPVRQRKRDDHNWNPAHSVELFVDANNDKQTYVQYIWGIDGSILDGRKLRDANGMLKMDKAGFTSNAEFAVARYPDRWTLEARIPAKEFGAAPKKGGAWRANLCRNLVRSDGKREATSTVLMEGKSFHTPAKFTELRFLAKTPPKREPVINFSVAKKRTGQITIGDGTGYETVLDISLDTTKPLHNASLTAEVFSGNARKGQFAVFEKQSIQLLWRSREPIRHLVDTPVPGVQIEFHLKADEGAWTFRRSFGSPPERQVKARFIKGVSGQALADTAHFPAVVEAGPLFDSGQGTLEMWVLGGPPFEAPLPFGPKIQQVFFFQGPTRFDYPLSDNNRSVCLRRSGRYLTARVSTRAYQQLWTGAAVGNWQKTGWHHIAMQWAAADEAALSIQLYIDGRKASSGTKTKLHGKKWLPKTENYLVQLGAMITGAGPLGWPIDEVRVSNAPRYSATFTPPKRAALDGNTTVVFHFDGDLRGESKAGQTVMAKAGAGRS